MIDKNLCELCGEERDDEELTVCRTCFTDSFKQDCDVSWDELKKDIKSISDNEKKAVEILSVLEIEYDEQKVKEILEILNDKVDIENWLDNGGLKTQNEALKNSFGITVEDEKVKFKSVNLEDVKEKWFIKGELSQEEISSIIGMWGVKSDRLLMIENVLENIPMEYCTPKVKKDIELALKLIQHP